MRAAIHYLVAAAILTIYGGQVCPLIAELDLSLWAVICSVFFLAGFLAHLWLARLIEQRMPYREQSARVFVAEQGIFVGMGLGIAVFDWLAFGFDALSGLKVVLGSAPLGFFAAADMALFKERRILAEIAGSGSELYVSQDYTPVSRRFVLVASAAAAAAALILFLIVSRDLAWLSQVSMEEMVDAQLAILGEMAFVTFVFLAYLLRLIMSYAGNLSLLVENQKQGLAAAAGGDLDSRVVVATNDEFGLMATYTNAMIESLKARTQELMLTRDVTILAMASLAETRDNETGEHILRTQRYVRLLATHLRSRPRFADFLRDPETIDLLFKSAPLHDVGKVGVPDAILLKPGRLTPEEFEEMKKHATYGRDTLLAAERRLGENSFLRLARQIAYTHHEKWDGSGYPQGLGGEQIPIPGRLMALADVYDALISRRVYKPAFTHEKARQIILEGRGAHFDPEVVEAFVALEADFKLIATKIADKKPEYETA